MVIGQHVRVLVDVLFPGEMPRPPRVSLPEMPGAQILRFETQATTMSDRIDGKDHVGQRFEFALYPRRGGTLEVPAPQVTVLDRAGEETGRLRGSPSDRGRRAGGRRSVEARRRDDGAEARPALAARADRGVQGGRRAGAHDHSPGGRHARHGDARPRLRRTARCAGLCRSAANRRSRRARRPHGPAHRSGHLCVRARRLVPDRRRRSALVGSRSAAGCGGRKGPARPWPLPLWRHRRRAAIASSFGSMS